MCELSSPQQTQNSEAVFSQVLDEMRVSFLNLVDVIERGRGVTPRTSEIRRWYRGEGRHVDKAVDLG